VTLCGYVCREHKPKQTKNCNINFFSSSLHLSISHPRFHSKHFSFLSSHHYYATFSLTFLTVSSSLALKQTRSEKISSSSLLLQNTNNNNGVNGIFIRFITGRTKETRWFTSSQITFSRYTYLSNPIWSIFSLCFCFLFFFSTL
jgi:hypothetical protein